ncbi:hypothetical protein CSC78_16765 [Pseudoxanthomonas japonensis]|uniref:Uncharacterized protein n=1 Tax=Pseudoxanthomonas japonensis TaxID=69284 RepID=A0ABQ6ZD98_9GAMM|nr:hypothetical protein CSC78_16765 [Pseudoxanthomonas japonensis]
MGGVGLATGAGAGAGGAAGGGGFGAGSGSAAAGAAAGTTDARTGSPATVATLGPRFCSKRRVLVTRTIWSSLSSLSASSTYWPSTIDTREGILRNEPRRIQVTDPSGPMRPSNVCRPPP